MTLTWMLGAVVAGALLGLAALGAERIAAWFRLPRRWVWVAAMAGTLALPVAALAARGAMVRERPTGIAPWYRGGPVLPEPLKQVAPNRWEYQAPDLAPRLEATPWLWAWIAASLSILALFAAAQRRLRAACGACEARVVEGTPVLVSERAGPMVLGLARPRIVLPRWAVEGPEDELRLIVRHEREHLAARDGWMLSLAGLAVAAVPWSLALWWQHRRLRLALETDCDARVLARGEDPRAYGRVLLRAAGSEAFLCAPAAGWGGRRSDVARRIEAIAARPPRRVRAWAVPLAAGSVAVAVAAYAAAYRAAPPPIHVRTSVENGREMLVLDPSYYYGIGLSHPRDMGTEEYLATTGTAEEYLRIRTGRARRFRDYPRVAWVRPGSSVAKGGLRVGDVVVSENGRDPRVLTMIPTPPPGTPQTLRVRRGAAVREIRFAAGPLPSPRELRLQQITMECFQALDRLPPGSRVRCPSRDPRRDGAPETYYRVPRRAGEAGPAVDVVTVRRDDG